MKALILNSGIGSRMGNLTQNCPKCMVGLSYNETILSRQLRQLIQNGVTDVVITTGYMADALEHYCRNLDFNIRITFINNSRYRETNNIYSVYCAKDELKDDVIFMHGDLVFEDTVLKELLTSDGSVAIVSSTTKVPRKDFKAVISNGRIEKIGVEFFDKVLPLQPLYKFMQNDWEIWLSNIISYCENEKTDCYAETAFNDISNDVILYPVDIKNLICSEIDDNYDYERVRRLITNG